MINLFRTVDVHIILCFLAGCPWGARKAEIVPACDGQRRMEKEND